MDPIKNRLEGKDFGYGPTESLIRPLGFLLRNSFVRRALLMLTAALIIGMVILTRTPSNFPSKTIIRVNSGETVGQVGNKLAAKKIIGSELAFKLIMKILDGKNGVKAGDYYFNGQTNILTVAYRFANADFGLESIKVTIPEGSNVFQIAQIIKKSMPAFADLEFVKAAQDKEGYLFPDTYFFLPNSTPQEIIDIMSKNFREKIKQIQDRIDTFGKPVEDVIKVASYIEEEARLTETRRTISGIIWKRLEIGMPLQIDSTFQYVNGKNTFELTLEDLKIDSPYNTYKYRGLTPTPISNPGLDSIIAAITPIETKYIYFLSDREGDMHYAITLDEHNANKIRYLK